MLLECLRRQPGRYPWLRYRAGRGGVEEGVGLPAGLVRRSPWRRVRVGSIRVRLFVLDSTPGLGVVGQARAAAFTLPTNSRARSSSRAGAVREMERPSGRSRTT